MNARVAGMVLAAGQSRRLGTAKQLVIDEFGESLVVRSARQLLEAGCSPVVVVVGAHGTEVAAAVLPLGVVVSENADWEEGMGSSIRRGIRELLRHPDAAAMEAVVIATCDMPGVSSAHIQELIAIGAPGETAPHSRHRTPNHTQNQTWSRVGSEYNVSGSSDPTRKRVRGIPVLLPRADWPVLSTLSGDRGAKSLIELPGTLSVFLRTGHFDIDTPFDLAGWRASHSAYSTPTYMSTLAQTGLADLGHEIENTRKVLSRVPADHLQFSPHEKSWPLQSLASHLTQLGYWGFLTLTTDVLDLAQPQPPRPPAPETAEAFVAQFDERMAAFQAELAKATDEQLMESWTLRMGEQVLLVMPRIGILRSMVVNHMIHHRAQLTIYLRLLNIPVPGMYGPSADES